MADLPWPDAVGEIEADHGRLHSADITALFWGRMREARLALTAGSVLRAERVLRSPAELPRLPRHLRVMVLVELAFLAALASDEPALDGAGPAARGAGSNRGGRAGPRAARGPARQQARGGRALRRRDQAQLTAQPAVLPLALTCAAQMYDALGDRDRALAALQSAVTATEVRGNAVPFLGWTRQGAPSAPAPAAAHRAVSSNAWARDLADGDRRSPGGGSGAGAVDPLDPGAGLAEEPVLRPDLSPRERDVLHELARGSTYADIAASLFVSENTVKTHVSSLYGKLAVNRRSEALAVARNFDLL